MRDLSSKSHRSGHIPRQLAAVFRLIAVLGIGLFAIAHADDNDSSVPTDVQSRNKGKKPKQQKTPVPQLLNTACDYDTQKQNTWYDQTHKVITRSVCAQAVRFDRFFGNIRSGDDYTSSRLRIRNTLIFEKEETVDAEFRPRVRGRFHLPNFEEQFNIIIFDDSTREDTLSSAEEIVPEQQQDENRYSAALRWIVRKSEQLQLDFDVGARFNSGIEPLVRLRYRKTFPINDRALTRLTNTVYWRKTEEFGNRLELNYERMLTLNTLFLWHTGGTFSEVSEGIEWNKRLTLYHALDRKRAISYTFGMNGKTRPYPVIDNLGISVRFRRNVLRPWLFIELEPAINWPTERDRQLTPSIAFRLEANFGDRYVPGSKERLHYYQKRHNNNHHHTTDNSGIKNQSGEGAIQTP